MKKYCYLRLYFKRKLGTILLYQYKLLLMSKCIRRYTKVCWIFIKRKDSKFMQYSINFILSRRQNCWCLKKWEWFVIRGIIINKNTHNNVDIVTNKGGKSCGHPFLSFITLLLVEFKNNLNKNHKLKHHSSYLTSSIQSYSLLLLQAKQ